MSNLYLMFTVFDRKRLKDYVTFYQTTDADVQFLTLARGTAVSETLDTLGLDGSEKVVMTSVVTKDTWRRVRTSLRTEMNIEMPGAGVAFTVPMSSIGGKRQLALLLGKQKFTMEEESTLKNTEYELLVVICRLGYTDQVMDAARKANAGGGTVIHAKGTGVSGAETFLGVTLASEKEMIYIVTRREDKNRVMRAIMEEAGVETGAKAVVFSLPVTDTAGLRFYSSETEPEAKEETV